MTEAARWRRWVRRAVWGVLGLVALVALGVGGVLLYLTSSSGERWLLAKGLPIANEQLSGRLETGSVDLSLTGLTVRDVKLYTPEGELVAEVALVDARLSLMPLAMQHVELTSARLERPRLYLVQDERGLNLARALEPKQPKPEEPDQGPGKLRLTLKDFKLEDGYVDFVGQAEQGPDRLVRLEDFDATGSASYGAAKRSFNVRLDSTGGLTRPVTGPVKLALRGQGEEENLSTDVSLTVAGLELMARGGMRGVNEAWLELQRLSVEPDTVRAFVPTYPLLVPVALEGNGQKQGDVARTEPGSARGQGHGGPGWLVQHRHPAHRWHHPEGARHQPGGAGGERPRHLRRRLPQRERRRHQPGDAGRQRGADRLSLEVQGAAARAGGAARQRQGRQLPAVAPAGAGAGRLAGCERPGHGGPDSGEGQPERVEPRGAGADGGQAGPGPGAAAHRQRARWTSRWRARCARPGVELSGSFASLGYADTCSRAST